VPYKGALYHYKVRHCKALRLCTGRTAHRGNRVILLLFLDNGIRSGWGVSVTPRPLFTSGKGPVPILQEAGWAPGPVWTGADNLAAAGIRSPDRPARSHSLYRLRYPAHHQPKEDRKINPVQWKCVGRISLCVYEADRLNICGIEQRKIWEKNETRRQYTCLLNPLTPNALLTSKRCILCIYSTNIGTEYFKHSIYSPFFSSSKCSLFHNSNIFGSCFIHVLCTGVLKLKKHNSGANRFYDIRDNESFWMRWNFWSMVV